MTASTSSRECSTHAALLSTPGHRSQAACHRSHPLLSCSLPPRLTLILIDTCVRRLGGDTFDSIHPATEETLHSFARGMKVRTFCSPFASLSARFSLCCPQFCLGFSQALVNFASCCSLLHPVGGRRRRCRRSQCRVGQRHRCVGAALRHRARRLREDTSNLPLRVVCGPYLTNCV